LRAAWLMAIVVLMVGVRYFVPWFAEEVQYSITRGKERAQYEQASLAIFRNQPLAQISQAGQLVTKRIGPSVVHINVTSVNTASEENELLPFPFGRRDMAGQGSGVIVDASGYILTNYHVVRGALEIDVGLSDGRRVGGQLIGYDEGTDIAVLKIDADELIAAQWGDSDRLEVGALVWAAGSPFGLQRTVTFGIVSAKHRAGMAGTAYQDFLQTDAAVNPGNSGGPLVDELGRVVGINAAIVGEAYQGVSFAVPSNVARDVYDRLRHDGRVARGWLGVEMDEVNEALADRLGLARALGVLVVNVVEINGHSPAKYAGIEPGDVILTWNGEEVGNPTTLRRLVGRTQVGAAATVVLRRGTDDLQLSVTVGERPPLE
jgi:S1-C subfamily serine protease